MRKGESIKVSAIIFLILITISLVSAPRVPTVGGDNAAWGDILNEYLNALAGDNATSLNQTMVNGTNIYESSINATHILNGTITDEDISDTTNLTLGEKITFTLGGIIDNIADDWITISGNLNVTENITVEGNVTADYFIGDGSLLTNTNTTNLSYVPYTGANQNINLGNNNLTVNGTTLFVNTNTSRVGIGTTSPRYSLEVTGIILASTGYYIGSEGFATISGNDLLFRTTSNNALPIFHMRGKADSTAVDGLTIVSTWVNSTYGFQKTRSIFNIFDTSEREAIRLESNGTSAFVGIGGEINSNYLLTVNGSILANGTINSTTDICVPNLGICLSNVSTNLSYVPYTGANQNVNLSKNNFSVSNQTGNTLFIVDTNTSRVGIGTTSPTQKLTIDDGNLAFTTAGQRGLMWPGGSVLYEQTVLQGGVDRMIYQPNGDRFEVLNEAGSAFLAGFHGANSNVPNSIRLYKAVAIGNLVGYAQSGTLPFDGLVVAGNVGIGTSNPLQKLHVNGSILANGTINATEDVCVNNTCLMSNLSNYVPYTGANQNVNLGNNNLTVNGTTLFVNTNTSRVGIGTTSPRYSLEVTGIILASTGYYIGSEGFATISGNDLLFRTTSNNALPIFHMRGKADSTAVDGLTIVSTWVNSTYGFQKTRSIFNIFDTSEREAIRLESNGTSAFVGIGGEINSNYLLTVNGSILANGTINSTGGFGVGANSGITGNYSLGTCWMTYTGGILTGTNCTAL